MTAPASDPDHRDQEAIPAGHVTLLTTATPFEAHTVVAVLENGGVAARAFDRGTEAASITPTPRESRIAVLVRRDDVERARSLLRENLEDSVAIDWEEIDVGAREDDLPMTPAGRMPPAARVAFIVAVIVLVLGLIAGVVMIVV